MEEKAKKLRRIKLRILFGRTVLAAVFLNFVILLFYIAGSIREYSDQVQLLLLNLMSFFSLFLFFCSLAGLIQSLFLIFSKTPGRRHKWQVLIYTLLMVFSITVALAALLMISAAGGNLP